MLKYSLMKPIQCRAGKHGDHSLELNFDYPVNPDSKEKKKQYSLTLLFFTPIQLRINSSNYPQKLFLKDMTTYTRFGTMRMKLSEINNIENPKSPITRITHCFKQYEKGQKLNKKRIQYELKNFTNYLLSGLINETRKVKNLSNQENLDLTRIKKASQSLLKNIVRYRETRDNLSELFANNDKSEDLNQALKWSEESVSIKTEKALWRVYVIAKKNSFMELERESLRQIDIELLRKGCRNISNRISIDNPKLNQQLMLREHLLKRWSQQILYMTVTRTRNAKRLTDFFINLAAGTAFATTFIMTFILSDKIKEQGLIGISLAVIIYVLRDRMKDLFRHIFLKTIPILVSDREKKVIDPFSKKRCGSTRERADYIPFKALPEDFQRIRCQNEAPLERELRDETVLRYDKNVTIESQKLCEHHPRLKYIKEILRIDMKEWFQKMDKAEESLYKLENSELKRIKTERVYHIHLVLKISDHKRDKNTDYYKFRIVANRKRILDIIKMESKDS